MCTDPKMRAIFFATCYQRNSDIKIARIGSIAVILVTRTCVSLVFRLDAVGILHMCNSATD